MHACRKVYLYGNLAEQFTDCVELAVDTVAEAVRGLGCAFGQQRFNRALKAGRYFIMIGANKEDGQSLSEQELAMHLGEGNIHIVPEAIGAGGGRGKGIVTIIVGIALVAVAIMAPYTAPAIAGAAGVTEGAALSFTIGVSAVAGSMASSLITAGVAGLLTPTPDAAGAELARESPDERPSFLFNGPVNTMEQGGPVPVVYGRFIIGSKVISGGITVEETL